MLMKAPSQSVSGKEEQTLVITRFFDAPRDLVWKAWTEPGRFMHWWGPAGFTSPLAKIDLRVGGKVLACMRSPDGKDFWSTGTYREIVPQERIVTTDSFADEKGNVVSASHYGMKGAWPMELLITVTLGEENGGTRLTLQHEGFPDRENRDLAGAGWEQSFDKLAWYLADEATFLPGTRIIAEPGKLTITIIRVFDAPREKVFRAYTDPKLIPLWWGPERYATTVERMEARTGGSWRYIQRDAGGNEFAFHGVYHEITSPLRIVDTFEFEGMPGHVMLEVADFRERGGRTKVTGLAVFQTVGDRDGMAASGMEEGVKESTERLARLLLRM
ncbi:MAG: SRPBCC domain-containing protein [Methanomicrobiales archaeon]|nr:SRPBCC domain-containing protein [Methanomicrobiales archaeon]